MPDFEDIAINATAEELEAVARMGTAPEDDKLYGRKNGEWTEVDFETYCYQISYRDFIQNNDEEADRKQISQDDYEAIISAALSGSCVIQYTDSASQTSFMRPVTRIIGGDVEADDQMFIFQNVEGEATTSCSVFSDSQTYYISNPTTDRLMTGPDDYYTKNETKTEIANGFKGNYITAGQKSDTTLGTKATAEGINTTASGAYSHSEGDSTSALGYVSHAEGAHSSSTAAGAHAEGRYTVASGVYSHAEGGTTNISDTETYTVAGGDYSHAEGLSCRTTATAAHAEGYQSEASGSFSHAEGIGCKTTAAGAHAEGSANKSNGANSHTSGQGNIAGYSNQTVIGKYNDNKSDTLFEVGNGTSDNSRSNAMEVTSSGKVIAGTSTSAADSGTTLATKDYVDGKQPDLTDYYNKEETDALLVDKQDTLVSGTNIKTINGESVLGSGDIPVSPDLSNYVTLDTAQTITGKKNLSNVGQFGIHAEGFELYPFSIYRADNNNGFTIQFMYGNQGITFRTKHIAPFFGVASDLGRTNRYWTNGYITNIYGDTGTFTGSVTSGGADYAEYFEWEDGNPDNEDRIGLFVTLDGEKIRLAHYGDEILGITSGTVAFLGDNYETEWQGKYLRDNFGRYIYEEYEYTETEINEETGEEYEVVKIGTRPKLNPDYDPEKEYIPRSKRAEWETVGMLGKLFVEDDGTCEINGYVTVSENGIATASVEKTSIRVLARVTDNIIKVLLK